MLRFPESLTPQGFLDRYWQKRPLFLPNGVPHMAPVIDDDELAWLATEDDVESRLVFTEVNKGKVRYRMEHGPFTADFLQRLPATNWTLLVQDVDKHLPDFRAYFSAASFVPDWRIDDLMISIAAPGGSVGPHRDNYDVFLLQASGSREWNTTTPEAAVPERRSTGLALLKPFAAGDRLTATPSDLLYLPPGIPHWGIAKDRCTTYSLGMRAPQRRELQESIALFAASDGIARSDVADGLPGEEFYVDPDLVLDESYPGMISDRALQRASTLLRAESAVDPLLLARAFGSAVTMPKPRLAPDNPDPLRVSDYCDSLGKQGEVRVHGMARLAWCDRGSDVLLFANGNVRSAGQSQLHAFRNLCAGRSTAADRLEEADRGLLPWLVATGALDLADIDPPE
jgi:50S ribosomal protein L16 3-hydroxylase